MPERHSIRVHFESGNYLDTEINGTPEEIQAYYVGNVFNLGNGDQDRMDKAVSVAIDPTTYTNILTSRKAIITTEDEGHRRCWQRIELQDEDTITVTWRATYDEACRVANEWIV